MASKYQKAFMQFLTEVKSIEDASDAVYEMSDEFANVVVLSGEIVGRETNEEINEIGQKYGLLVLARYLNVVLKRPEIN